MSNEKNNPNHDNSNRRLSAENSITRSTVARLVTIGFTVSDTIEELERITGLSRKKVLLNYIYINNIDLYLI
jgi:hypothetical protein